MSAEKKPQRQALGEAVATGIIANETLAYFIGRTYLFMERIGISTDVRHSPAACNMHADTLAFMMEHIL